ncbi:hypothetical protein [Flavobacterium sp. KACC 22761]|uniref:hypothetical protein n=1 Tax=Flavobacterium sp. KACC 22761 TaxID=3092665 RepID=UPI002A763BE2|nr:hypothetical protein [Flavobacterium sp. KACC 22761]WPO80584.1 hypothetical protein SCB73_09380 [Flavobacterium sp. KACC 22761]
MKFKYIVLIVFVSVFLSRCASSASIKGMTVKDYKVEKQIGDQLYIKSVTGGKKTNPLWVSNISNKNFEEALKKSFTESNAFTKTEAITDGDWVLEVNIISVSRPKWFNLTVETTIEYKLYNKNNLVFSKSINQSGNATMSDAIIGSKRLRLANEISAKNNIKTMLQSLDEMAR